MKKTTIRLVDGMGRGLFAEEDIRIGEIIERFPNIVLSEKDAKFVWTDSEVMKHYFFFDHRDTVIMCGRTSMCNHSLSNNCEVDTDDLYEYKLVSTRNIKRGEELTINYHFDGEDEFLPKEYVKKLKA
jgi:SET domain-containing protein